MPGTVPSMNGVTMLRFGGPTTLIEVAGWRLLTDPTFDPPGRRYGFGFGSASTKLAGPSRPSAALGRVDAVLLSHDHHADNLDDAGRALLSDVPTVVTTNSGARRLAAANVRGLRPWQTTTLSAPGLPSLEITATPRPAIPRPRSPPLPRISPSPPRKRAPIPFCPVCTTAGTPSSAIAVQRGACSAALGSNPCRVGHSGNECSAERATFMR